jgi:hypothetical protein
VVKQRLAIKKRFLGGIPKKPYNLLLWRKQKIVLGKSGYPATFVKHDKL